jgi:hypothetical protein
MAKNKVSEWSSTAASNTDVGGIDIAEGCAPSGINNAIRELMAQVKDMQTGSDADNYVVGGNLSVTGATTLTGAATATTQIVADDSTKLATTAFVKSALAIMYPVGSIYTATVSTNPNTLFGFGTWVAFGAGRVLIGNGGGFTAGATGGSADAVVVSHTHTATVTDAGHYHSISTRGSSAGSGNFVPQSAGGGLASSNTDSAVTGITVSNSTEGVSGTNANLQPYIVVYIWQRTV